jgi:hypothetical protein
MSKGEGALKMRISLADSQMNGFKRWSDAQRGSDCEVAEIDARLGPVAQLAVAPANEDPGDAAT